MTNTATGTKRLVNCIKLACKITVYVPGTTGAATEGDTSAYVDSTAALLSELFGGATSTPAAGYWMSKTFGLIRERTTIVFAYADSAKLDAGIDDVVVHCEAMRDAFGQEAVALEVNGEMYFI
ncbi:MAG: hypothetical protein AB7D36_05595 [Oscillospiraceae bacterium]